MPRARFRSWIPGRPALFPALSGRVFLDAACISLAPRPAVEGVERVARLAATCPERDASAHHVALDRLREEAQREGARLLGASEDEVALVESSTHGLAIAAQAIPFRPEDTVVLGDTELLQVALPWVKLAEQGRSPRCGSPATSAGRSRWTPSPGGGRAHPGGTVASSAQWRTGCRVDLPALSRLCREGGAFLVVDAIQELGALRVDVRQTPIDLLVAGGHEWLSAPLGCGLLHVSRQAQASLRETSLGYLSLEEPQGG